MPKQVKVTIDPETADFSVDLTGFEGKGCSDVAKVFEDLGEVTKDQRKPEFLKKNTNVVRAGQ